MSISLVLHHLSLTQRSLTLLPTSTCLLCTNLYSLLSLSLPPPLALSFTTSCLLYHYATLPYHMGQSPQHPASQKSGGTRENPLLLQSEEVEKKGGHSCKCPVHPLAFNATHYWWLEAQPGGMARAGPQRMVAVDKYWGHLAALMDLRTYGPLD